MEGTVIGIDLCDAYTQLSCGEEKTWTIPTVICRHKSGTAWFVGQEAYAHTLTGDGSLVDKLVSLCTRSGTATLGEVCYSGTDLMAEFLRRTISLAQDSLAADQIRQAVLAVRTMDTRLLDSLYAAMERLGFEKDRVRIISHAEALTCYVLSQKKEVWSGTVGVFDLAAGGLRYYEMRAQRGLKTMTVTTEFEDQEESFNLDVLSSASGAKLGDKILNTCARRLMAHKAFSSVILMGKGFESRDWAEDFMRFICTKRRVYFEPALFARGAALRAADLLREKSAFPYTILCEGRLFSTVSLNVMIKGKETPLVLASAGEDWYQKKTGIDVILDRQDTLDLVITPVGSRKSRTVCVELKDLPERPPRTTRLSLCLSFLDGHTMDVQVADRGFGELFPASDMRFRKEITV